MDVFGIFISPFIQAMVDKLSSYFSNLVSTVDIGTGIHNLKKALEDLETLLADAENKQTYHKDIKKWLEEVYHLAYDADDILDDFATDDLERKLMADETTIKRRPAKFPRLSDIVPFNLKNGSKLIEITSQLQEVATKGKELGLDNRLVGRMSTDLRQRSQTTCLKEPHIHGRDEDIKQIIELLLADAPAGNFFDVIPIVGMGGIGKTTLAQHIYNDDRVENYFNLKAWVCVSDDFEVTRITKAILASFTHGSCNFSNLNEVQVQLSKTLAGEKFLLVLDDVWDYGRDGWNLLRSPFGAGAPKLESIGKKIVENRCRGLPLAARALGSLLCCKQEEREWKEILNSNIWNEESGILTALKLSYLHLPVQLKRCFSYCAIIPKDYGFTEEELVLLWMAEGLIEQPKGGDQMEDLGRKYFHELVSRSFFQLLSGNKSLFIMHDLINDLAQDVAGDKCFRLENNLEGGRQSKISVKARHASYVGSYIDGIKKFKVFDDAKCLRTFLQFFPLSFHATRYLFHDLLPKLKCLRELRLHYNSMDELQDSIGDLKHLRYLDVSCSGITRLPDTVVTLYNLQVLFLKFCHRLRKLPPNIGRLVNLRHFDMTGVHIPSSEEMSLHSGKLTNLQTLSNFMVGKDCGRKIGELKNLSHIRGGIQISRLENVSGVKDAREANFMSKEELNIRGAIHISRLENVSGVKDAREANFMSKEELKELSLEWGKSHRSQNDIVERDVLDVMKPFKLLERLTIRWYGSTKFPNWVGDVSFSKMVYVQLKGSKCCRSLPPLGQLPLLKDLCIEGMSAIKRLGCEFYGQQCGAKPFPSLERLSFEFMPEWEEWSAFETEGVQPFSHLIELSIKNCPKLVGRLPNDLPCLNSLKIDGCPQLLIDVSSLVQPSLASLSMNNVILPRESHVTVLNSLCDPSTTDEELLANEMSNHLTSITALSISDIEKLAFLPTWFTQDLMGLEKLDISNCQELITLWRNKINYCYNLEPLSLGGHDENNNNMNQLSSLQKLCLYKCRAGMVSYFVKEGSFPTNITSLEIGDFVGQLPVPPPSPLEWGLHKLSSLTTLQLQGRDWPWRDTVSFPEEGMFLPTSLLNLTILQFPNLERLSYEEFQNLTSLQTLEIWGCPRLASFPKEGLPPSLLLLSIYNCPELATFPEQGLPPSLLSLDIGRCNPILKQKCEKGKEYWPIIQYIPNVDLR
ncbi:putative disease resistance RPP13-like protein 1 [Camellia sinensis]|uniref:putative disease resistance RPP13-like protein 1 n=1 Tax=Camellia sinensis TaxID=4442 RepID=UPI001036DA40|nr:putative disease resistance RPP13-like protein 1 [Camellia sinensis]